MGSLYFGDNLDVLRKYVKDESADLIYLDPPFNSDATYSVIFKDGAGAGSEAQAEAFRDTWRWGPSAALAYDELMKGRGDLAVLMQALRACLGQSGRMAYLAMMAVRLIELHRVLKPTGSLYLHCDPTESHYLKIILDTVFDQGKFRNEVIWKRTGAHSAAKRWAMCMTLFCSTQNRTITHGIRYSPHTTKFISRDTKIGYRMERRGRMTI